MERKTTVYLALALFICLAAFTVIFIVQRNKENSFEISRENVPTENQTDNTERERTDTPQENDKESNEEEATPETQREEMDYAPLVERYRGKEIIKVNTAEKAVALTFDAGANADGVEPVLAILKENDIRGTFFLTGKFIERYPDKVKEIMMSGGDIGNHTYDHPYLTQLTTEQVREKITGAEKALAEVGGDFQPFLRAPYGDRNAGVLSAVSEAGYINIRWTIDSLGWKGISGGMTKDTVRDKVLKNSAPGAIIMMHLGSNPDDKTHLDSEALPEIIARLRADGYEFVTLSELLQMER